MLVLEARDRLGGRTWYKQFGDTGRRTEMGGTWFDEPTQLNIAREIQRYSLPTVLSPAGQEFRVSLCGRSLPRPDQPVPREFRPDLDKALDHIIEQSRRVTFGADLDNPDLHDLDVSFAEFIAPYTDQPFVAEYLTMWSAFAFGCHPSENSALQVLTWVAGYDNAVWTLDDAPATKFAKGTASLVDALADDSGADIELSAPVASIADAGDHIEVSDNRRRHPPPLGSRCWPPRSTPGRTSTCPSPPTRPRPGSPARGWPATPSSSTPWSTTSPSS